MAPRHYRPPRSDGCGPRAGAVRSKNRHNRLKIVAHNGPPEPAMRVTRRAVLHTGAAALAAPALGALALPSTLRAQERAWKHGLSLFGDLKYPEGFKHFDYVNPAAPKGGAVRHDRVRHLRQFQRASSPA